MMSSLRERLEHLPVKLITFNSLGININAAERDSIFNSAVKFAFLTLNCLLVGITIGGFIFKNLTDIDLIMESLLLFIQILLTFAKMANFLWYGRGFIDLMKASNALVAMTASASEIHHWQKANARQQMIISVYYLSAWFTALMLFSLTLILNLIIYIWSGRETFPGILPLQGLFPYDYKTPWYYGPTYVAQVLTSFYINMANVGVECLFLLLTYNFEAHFRILREKFIRLTSGQQSPRDSYPYFRHTFGYHQRILEIQLDFNRCFNFSILIEVMLSCLLVCFMLCHFVMSSKLKPYVVFYMISVCIKLCIYCFGGEHLKTECYETNQALALMPAWYNLKPLDRKLFLMPLQRAQHICALKGGFFELNNALLLWIFQTAMSLVTMLVTVKELQ